MDCVAQFIFIQSTQYVDTRPTWCLAYFVCGY